jgi:hypothetical protein
MERNYQKMNAHKKCSGFLKDIPFKNTSTVTESSLSLIGTHVAVESIVLVNHHFCTYKCSNFMKFKKS